MQHPHPHSQTILERPTPTSKYTRDIRAPKLFWKGQSPMSRYTRAKNGIMSRYTRAKNGMQLERPIPGPGMQNRIACAHNFAERAQIANHLSRSENPGAATVSLALLQPGNLQKASSPPRKLRPPKVCNLATYSRAFCQFSKHALRLPECKLRSHGRTSWRLRLQSE